MADSKTSALTLHTSPVAEDLFYVVDDPNGTPTSKRIRFGRMANTMPNTSVSGTLSATGNTSFSGKTHTVSANATFSGNVAVSGDKLHVATAKTPSSNSESVGQGAIFWDSSYLYVAVANTTIKRVALSDF